MNEKFFQLPIEKQQKIINAGFKVFSENSYKKSPVGEIADAACISKSLLFHYFKNKKELYLFLWEISIKKTKQPIEDLRKTDFKNVFQLYRAGLEVKLKMTENYPYLAKFAIRAYYETGTEISEDIKNKCEKLSYSAFDILFSKFKNDDYIDGLNVSMLYKEMLWASDGLMRILTEGNNIDVKTVRKEFLALVDFWESVYLKK